MGVKERLISIFSKSIDEALADDPPVDEPAEPEAVADKGAPEPEPEPDDLAARFAAMEAGFETLQRAVVSLAERIPEPVSEAEVVDATADEACPCTDGDTIARAEILAPGIAKIGDVKTTALKLAYGTEDGRAAIDLLLAGRSFDSADTDTMFVAASELLKLLRTGMINTVVSMDNRWKRGPMTPDEINELNAKHYGAK